MSRSRFAAIAFILFGAPLAPIAAQAAATRATSNLNLRAGAEIDVYSVGRTWGYTSWAGRQGHASHDYLIHQVTAEIAPTKQLTNLRYHSIFPVFGLQLETVASTAR